MSKVKCLNCEHGQKLDKNNTFHDGLGKFTVCKKCDNSYDIE